LPVIDIKIVVKPGLSEKEEDLMEEEIAVSPEEFKKRLDRNEVTFLFDLRNTDEFEAWRIEGRADIQTVNIPQIRFVGEEERHFGVFPRDRRIYTVCAHGDSSKYTAELLRANGFDARSLGGGMDAWSELYEINKIHEGPDIYQCYRVAKGCISYLVVSGREALVIDAARHTDRLLELAGRLGVKIRAVLETHLQADHISGGREVAQRSETTYFINSADCAGADFDYSPLKKGEIIDFGQSGIEIVPSPGHTPGSTSFLMDGKFLFTGDIVMKTSIGRPDLGGKADEWSVLLYDTLFNAYAAFDDTTVVLPSHAASLREQGAAGAIRSTLAAARRENDLFRIKDKGSFTRFIKESLPENPERYQEIRKVNLGLLTPDDAKKKELEIGKNLCGMAKKP
jgi:glyoxylase-like metal-dependent hydrolase (beta-lactamase superfamily II)